MRVRGLAWIGVVLVSISWVAVLRGFPHYVHPIAYVVVMSFGVDILPLTWLCLRDLRSYKSRCMRWWMLAHAITFAIVVLLTAAFGTGPEAAMVFWSLSVLLQMLWLAVYAVIAVAQESALR